MKSLLYKLCLLFGLYAWLAPALAEIDVRIDRNPVQVNESFQLVFSLDHNPDRDPNFSILQQHFIILSNKRSSSISIINGEYRRSVRWTLQLMAKQVGDYMIPAIRFDHERSKPFQISVKPSSLAAVPHDELVLELLTDQQQAYVQSQVVLTLRLLSAQPISLYQFGDVSFGGVDAVVEPMGSAREYQTRIADKSYRVVEKQIAVFPQESGELKIDPVSVDVRLPSTSSFDPFQTGSKVRRLQSQAVSIGIDPIPPEFSGDYWLPADRVELREKWHGDLDQLKAGEPVTRSLMLIADGLTATQLPELKLPAIDGVKQYPDQPALQNQRSSDGISGRREQKIALIPSTTGSFVVPEISIPWWNRNSGNIEIARIPARRLEVSGAAIAVPAAPAPVAPAAEARPEVLSPPSSRFWIWVSLVLALGWALSGGYWWWRWYRPAVQSAENSASAGLRQARRQLRQACEQGDAVAARLALLAWCRALPISPPLQNLQQLGAYFGSDLQARIAALNQCLYAAEADAWQGGPLWSLCRELERGLQPQTPVATQLQSLNPGA